MVVAVTEIPSEKVAIGVNVNFQTFLALLKSGAVNSWNIVIGFKTLRENHSTYQIPTQLFFSQDLTS